LISCVGLFLYDGDGEALVEGFSRIGSALNYCLMWTLLLTYMKLLSFDMMVLMTMAWVRALAGIGSALDYCIVHAFSGNALILGCNS